MEHRKALRGSAPVTTIAPTMPVRQRQPREKIPEHLGFIRSLFCAVRDATCFGVIEAHHVITRGAGGSDRDCVPLCTKHHAEGHRIGWSTFQRIYKIILRAVAASLWAVSPANKENV